MNAIERKAWVSELDAAIADFARGFERISWMLEAMDVGDVRERNRLASLTADVRMRMLPIDLEILHHADLSCARSVAPQ